MALCTLTIFDSTKTNKWKEFSTSSNDLGFEGTFQIVPISLFSKLRLNSDL